MRLLPPLALATVGLTGCGVTSPSAGCDLVSAFTVSPATATASHTAVAPGNQVQFFSTIAPKALSGNCAIPQYIIAARPAWTNPDPLDIAISSANDATNGTATCNSATSGPVTLTANVGTQGTPSTQTVQLTCQ